MDFEKIVFISDQVASIAYGIEIVFPYATHTFCCWHLYVNLAKKDKGQIKYFKYHYWVLCKAYRKADFIKHFDVFTRYLSDCAAHSKDIGFERWSRLFSERSRYSYMTSNDAESMNVLTVHARKLPITMLLDYFQVYVQQWYFNNHNIAAALTTPVTPHADVKSKKMMEKSHGWIVRPSTNHLIEVIDGRYNGNVNLDDKTCSCGQWQKSGISCGHVLAMTRHFNQTDVNNYVESYFSTEWYRLSYAEHIKPLPSPAEWIDPGNL
ncbi:uncharacterized protein [Rutidosis leptorrhynchoides]|uniref:uncharacterized protein n=1 Tax=Rutidosis leptorrhynchoides TaxID=125765 RepID=UPI003A991B2F